MAADNEILSKGELVAAFFEKRLKDNLDVFKQYLPNLYEEFKAYQEERFYLIYDSEGNVNLFDKEKEILKYGANPAQEILDNYEAYKLSAAQRPFYTIGMDANEKVNPVHSRFLSQLGDVQRKLIGETAEASLEATIARLTDPSFNSDDDCPLVDAQMFLDDANSVVWFSIGLGFDLEKAYAEKKIRHLYLLEPNRDIFFASLQIVDWSAIISKMLEENLSIYIGVDDDWEQLVAGFSDKVYAVGRHNFAGAYFYSSFYLEGYEELFESVKKQVNLKIFSGFGFYDDSRLSLAHTIGNFVNQVPCITCGSENLRDVGQSDFPVLVIGNGPSIDKDIDFIRSSLNKAIVISCGTALSTLYNNGIKPDIHVELERTGDVVTFARGANSSPEYFEYLKGIRFIGASQVHPDMFALFDVAGQMPKDVETGSVFAHKVLKGSNIALVGRIAPSCVHIGFSTAVVLGFREIYLFGTDMGYFDRNYHHSKSSLYEDMNEESTEKYTPSKVAEIEFDANFADGKVLSSGFLPLFKNELEISVGCWKENLGGSLDVFNCSDGARINNTEPMHSSDVDFQEPDFDKDEVLSSLMDTYFTYTCSQDDSERLKDEVSSSIALVDKVCDWLCDQVRDVSNIDEANELMSRLTYQFHQDKELVPDSESWVYSLIDGTLLYGFSAINTILYYPTDMELGLNILI